MEPYHYVKIQLRGKINYVKITKHEDSFEYKDFLLSASMYYNISCLDIDYFTDSHVVKICEQEFMDIFNLYKNHPDFILKVVLKTNETELIEAQILSRQNCRMGLDMFISVQDLENYMLKNKNAFILCKKYNENENLKPLSDMERRAIVRDCVDFLTEKYTLFPEPKQISALLLAAVQLFPQLKTSSKEHNGIDALYDRKKNRGFIVSRLNRVRQKLYIIEKGTGRSSRKRNLTSVRNDSADLNTELSEIEANENFLILKNLNTTTQKELIKHKLVETLNLRAKFTAASISQFSENFPFFFTSPDLILFDFELRYPNHHSNFINKWKLCSSFIFDVLKDTKGINYKGLPELDGLLPSMKDFVYLLNILPQVISGKASTHIQREPFSAIIQKIITFKPPNSTKAELVEGNSLQPYVIAEGSNKCAVMTYYLCVENELIVLPSNTSFIESMDILFKCHYIFGQHFENNLKTFWTFISYYFYGLQEEKLTSRIKEIASKLDQKLASN